MRLIFSVPASPKGIATRVNLLAFHHDHERLMDQPTAKFPIPNEKRFVGQVPRSWFGRPQRGSSSKRATTQYEPEMHVDRLLSKHSSTDFSEHNLIHGLALLSFDECGPTPGSPSRVNSEIRRRSALLRGTLANTKYAIEPPHCSFCMAENYAKRSGISLRCIEKTEVE